MCHVTLSECNCGRNCLEIQNERNFFLASYESVWSLDNHPVTSLAHWTFSKKNPFILLKGLPHSLLKTFYMPFENLNLIANKSSPETQSTTTRAPSVTRRAAVTSDEKSTWPGESIKLIKKPRWPFSVWSGWVMKTISLSSNSKYIEMALHDVIESVLRN